MLQPMKPTQLNYLKMKKILTCIISLLLLNRVTAQQATPISASMNKVKLDFILDAGGRPEYKVDYAEKPLINTSRLGIKLANDVSLDSNFMVINTERKYADEQWKPVWGEVSTIRNHYEQVTIHLKQKNSLGRLMNIVFRVFEDGVGFRYEFPVQPNLKYFIV